ncbi:MAG: NitT/TauT family transport system permease protein [Pseudonocardiales bacterium]|jgi:NitT/TauT family transport system permease protein|nr:NitT/TauT family transport system permease protein [Pseudonocardiales bacterium]
MSRTLGRWAGRTVLVVLALAVVLGAWEAYKDWGPKNGVTIAGARILPRTSDAAMPHLSTIWKAFGADEVGGAITLGPAKSVLDSVVSAGLHTLRWAAAGFAIGVVVGMLLALLMDRLRLAERALMPYVVLSQTVPLIALAPLVTKWGQGSSIGSFRWQPWMSVSVIAAYLAFFPVAVGMVRGLKSPSAVHAEYFRSSAAGWWRTLVRLKLPASVPFLVPALRLAAAGAVVGTIVAEISTGLDGGIGRLIITYSQQATGDPSRVYAAVIGAAVLGLVAAAAVTLVDLALWRYSRGADAR